MRPSIERNHTRFVDHLGVKDDVARSLHDLVTVVVGTWPHRSGYAAGDTSLPRPVVFEGVCAKRKKRLFLFYRLSLQRNSPIRWVDHHRWAPRTGRTVLHEPVGGTHRRPSWNFFSRIPPLASARAVRGPSDP